MSLGLPSCKADYNAPEEINMHATQLASVNTYPTGDSAGQSATAFKNFYDKCDWDNCSDEDGYIYSFNS